MMRSKIALREMFEIPGTFGRVEILGLNSHVVNRFRYGWHDVASLPMSALYQK